MLDIKEYFCPNDRCKHYGIRGEGNLMKAGTYHRKHSGERKQMLKCRVCGYRFSETQSTIFSGCHYGTLSKNHDKTHTPRTPALVAKLIEKNWTFESAYKKPLLL